MLALHLLRLQGQPLGPRPGGDDPVGDSADVLLSHQPGVGAGSVSSTSYDSSVYKSALRVFAIHAAEAKS